MLRLTDVRIDQTTRRLVDQVLDSGHLAQGRFVELLEQSVAEHSGTQYAVAVSNGTAALALALRAVGVGRGDEVIIPAFTFAGTANAVLAIGATPVLADIGADWQISPYVDDYITERTKAIVPVHLYGARAPVGWLKSYGLPVVEDGAQALGLPMDLGIVSLYGSKTVGCGEGGVIVTNDPDLDRWLRVQRNQGMTGPYEHPGPGFNWRMTDLQAAVAVGQLTSLFETLEKRRRNAEILWETLHDLPIDLPGPFETTWHLFTIGVDRRDDVIRRLTERGVEARVYYPQALCDLPWLQGDCPNARRAAERVLSIPVHQHLTGDDIAHVAEATREAIECVLVS